jgi:RNA polymerase sigma-54 factor
MSQLRPRLDQRPVARQALGMAPAQQQSIKLLEMSNLALAELVAEALAENPLLEPAAELPAAPPRRRRPPRAASAQALPAGLARLWSAATPARRTSGGGGAEGTATLAAAGPTLHEHLMQQLGADVADPVDRAIGRAIIEAVDEAGYLTGDIAELGARLGHPAARVEAVLARLQEFDPPGVAARGLAECLALQLADRGRLDGPMGALVENLDLLAKGDRATLMQRCGVDAARLAAMIAELRRLDPRPGLAFDISAAVAITPDIVVERGPDGTWRVELNDATLPRLALNEGYSVGGGDPAAKAYLRERRAAAQWLLRALDRRAETLLRVAGEIVLRQQKFLDGGPGELQPLSRREIASLLGLHESTVGRATSSKYAETPRGVLALADFFGGRLAGRPEDDGHAPAAVRARLRRLVEAETVGRPLSDGRLAELLRADGVAIARRTVAKYRELLRIPPSFQRRRAKTL